MYATGEIGRIEKAGKTEESKPRPCWGCLYGVTALLGALLTVVEIAIPDGPARRTLELFIALAMFGAMAVWVRVNRVGIALQNEGYSRGASLTRRRGDSRRAVR